MNISYDHKKKNILSLEQEGDSQESLTDEVAIPIKIIIIEFNLWHRVLLRRSMCVKMKMLCCNNNSVT